jgi:hypothetical protein
MKQYEGETASLKAEVAIISINGHQRALFTCRLKLVAEILRQMLINMSIASRVPVVAES